MTAGFLHGGLLHIGMNSWVLFDLGAQVEDVYGASRLIVVYFMATVGGFLLSTFWTPVAIGGRVRRDHGLDRRHDRAGRAQPPLAGRRGNPRYVCPLGCLYVYLRPAAGLNIDNAAHIGGLAAGFGVAYLAGTPRI